jgi:uncharacterized membrane protein
MVDWRESDEVNCSLAPLSTRSFTIRAVKQFERKESAMSDTSTVFVFIATYGSVDDAREDYEAVKELHRQGVIGTYDAAVVEKGPGGRVHVHKHEKPTQHGAWTGIVVGAVVGILFPVSIIGSAIIGGVTGGLIGHLWRGMSRGDMKDLGETLDEGQAALVVIGRSELAKKLEKAMSRAQKQIEKELKVAAKDFEKELEAAERAAQ